MRKIPFILCVLVTASVLLFGLKVFAVLYESMHESKNTFTKHEDIPTLINNLMSEGNMNVLKVYWTQSMDKLAEIGEPIVPYLIEAIETAHDRAEAVADRAKAVTYADISEGFINYNAEMLQTRAAMILGKIGDVRAVPVLTSLQCLEGGMICRYVNYALKSIAEQEHKRQHPEYNSDCTNYAPSKPKVSRRLGMLNAKAISFPEPELTAYDKRWTQPQTVRVEVIVNAGTGKVVWAQIPYCQPILEHAVKKVVCQVRFAPVARTGAPIYVSGFLIYKFK